MAAYHKQNSHANKKKVSISYVIREKDERYHRSGVNSLQYDTYLDRLYSAGRDSVIRIWGFKDDSSDVIPRTSNSNERSDGCKKVNNDHFLQSMEHHTDWVNDIVLCCNGRNLISVSNDTTIKVWDAHQGFCLSTLRSHKDYAKCLAHAKDREVLASAGFDRMIYLWDIHSLTMLTAAKTSVETKSLDGSRNSIYSLAINQTGTLVASGSTEKVIRLWDPRSRQKLLKLRGHTDNVRSLLFSKDGSMLLSASSDGTIRLWSITQQRCVSIIRVHDGGVWTLQSDDSFNTVFSGGKDGRIFMTSLKNTSNTALVCEEKSPILKILLVDRCYSPSNNRGNSSLWVATTDSGLKNWSIDTKNQDYFRDKHDHRTHSEANNDPVEVPINTSPDLQLKGNPAVVNYQILNDRRHILTRESDNSIALYDVLTARKIETLYSATNTDTREIYEAEIKKRFKLVYVPNWFTVDLKIGLLCIHLEENECLSAWVSAKDYGFTSGQDPKVNLGCLILKALLEHWPPTYESYDDDDFRESESQAAPNNPTLDDYHDLELNKNAQSLNRHKIMISSPDHLNGVAHRVGNQYFSIASHTPIIISEGSQTLLRFLAYEANNENEDIFLQEIIPPWLSDIVISKCQPKFTKIPFFLLPHADSGIKSLRKERLSASDMLQMHKVIEHVCEKMMVNIMNENGPHSMNLEAGSNSKVLSSKNLVAGSNSKSPSSSNEQTKFPINKVELYCNDQKLDEHFDLRTVKHYIWKSGGDLVLYYMPIK